MTVEQLEDGVMQLWRDCWNAAAFTRRKNHYRDLLRARHGAGNRPHSADLRANPELPVPLTA